MVNEATATRKFICSQSLPTELSKTDDEEFKDSALESITYTNMMMEKMAKMLEDVLGVLRQVFEE